MRLFYFLVYPRGGQSQIAVVDLQADLSYQRSEWSCVTPENYQDRDEAIREARRLSSRYGKDYKMFESRYGGKNEYLGEFE